MKMTKLTILLTVLLTGINAEAVLRIDETPGKAQEWGFRPKYGEEVATNPPGLSWRPQAGAEQYGIRIARDEGFAEVVYEQATPFTVHCPSTILEPGDYYWKFRYRGEGEWSGWSRVRRFSVPETAVEMPMPERSELLERIPGRHPRLFVRPEWITEFRKKAMNELKPTYVELLAYCDRLLKEPPPTKEPPTYPEGMKKGSDAWKDMWYGNRLYTQDTLHGAANLGFAYWLSGNADYGQLARRILMDCAEWDPRGSTGFRYNDEAAMPYNYHFARTYTFVQNLMSEEEKAKCREVMRIRGTDMYEHLYPDHFWKPYGSHNNRSWHFLGEMGIVFHGEIPEADDWVWAAVNVFYNAYPVWGDSDGGWHEGLFYMNAYLLRFTYWVDAMKAAFGINALKKPIFSKLGYFPMYLMPPGTRHGGFGDLTPKVTPDYSALLVSILASQGQNPYWQWYVDTVGIPDERAIEIPQEDGYFAFIRGALPGVEAKVPSELPSSRVFRGIGQAALNSNLLDGTKNIQIVFKSSPYASASHGYESQNAFLLNTYGEPMFIRSGRRDYWGSPFHSQWMWQTKSVNSILINGQGQEILCDENGRNCIRELNVGRIIEFQAGDRFDYVAGEVGDIYPMHILDRFERRILFCKPDVVVIHDILLTRRESTFQWLLHAPNEMHVSKGQVIHSENRIAECEVSFLWPKGLSFTQSSEFIPPPEKRIDLVEYHLAASTEEPASKQQFITVLRPHRKGTSLKGQAVLTELEGTFQVKVPLNDGHLEVQLDGGITARVVDKNGQVADIFTLEQQK